MIISCIFPQMIYIDSLDTLLKIRKQFGTDVNIKVGDWFKTSGKCDYVYVVKPLDTFASVANMLNINIEELKKIANTKHLFVGQKLTISK